MTEKHLKKCSTSLPIREIQIKNDSEVLLTTIRTAKIKSICTAHSDKDIKQGDTPPLLEGLQACTVTLDIKMTVSQKIGNRSTSRSSYSTPGHIPKGCPILPQGRLLNSVHNCFAHNSQKLERTQMYLNRRMDEENVVHLHSGILLSYKKKKTNMKLAGK